MGRSLDPGFDSRRIAIWYANRRWVYTSVAAVAALGMVAGLANAPHELVLAAAMVAAGLAGYTVSRVVRALNSLYRCPNCGTLPYQSVTDYKCGGLGPTRADFMSPTHCPKCGTRLR
jgi:hypothetical protein